MKRLYLFFGAMSWGARLQTLAILVILGWNAWIDINLGIWPVTIGIVLFTYLLGWLLKPVMMRFPRATLKIWSSFGLAFLMVYILAQNQWWWRTMLAHFGREFFMWLELSCGYWFLSEVRLRQLGTGDELESLDVAPAPTARKSMDDDSHHNYYAERSDSRR